METKTSLLTIKEVSKMLGVTSLTLRNWDKAGKLRALRHPLNNYRVYKREDIENFINGIASKSEPVVIKKKGPVKLEVQHLPE